MEKVLHSERTSVVASDQNVMQMRERDTSKLLLLAISEAAEVGLSVQRLHLKLNDAEASVSELNQGKHFVLIKTFLIYI
ncbi:hypothetical protein M5K25_026319 [Dendrobium thyrsiflorum]|uniref:Uncharacterized protein n=1 Tax=Dendrobium thyrsiflorum TaxID=117978 RepID=A0ABD0TWZ5_DENTH